MKPSLHHSHSTRDGSGHHNCLSASQREPRNPFFFLQRLFLKGSSVRGPWIQVMVTQLSSVAPSLWICQVSCGEGACSSWLLHTKHWLCSWGPCFSSCLSSGLTPLWRVECCSPRKGCCGVGGRGPVSDCCHLPLQHPLQSDWRSWWRWGNRLPFLISSEKRLGVWFKETS